MIGQNISHYKILEKLGEGGMGVVYKAHDTKLNRDVALKFLPHGLSTHEPERARFLQEAQAAAALNHPNICTIHDIAQEGDDQFIVMEYVDGVALREKIADGRMQLADCISYAIQIGDALQEAHSHGIVHRDVKTDNIMVNSKNQIKVMDFGLAKLKGSLKLTKTSSTVGTLAYMAPEQIQGGEVDARNDIFSFGVVLYEMLTGHTPFRGEHEAAMVYSIVNEEPTPLQKYLPEASSELVHILNRALEKDPEDRYQSVHDMVIDLRRLKKQTSRVSRTFEGTPSGDIQKEALPKARNKSRTYVVAGVSVILVVTVGILLIFRPSARHNQSFSVTTLDIPYTNIGYPGLSPDGKWLVFPAADANGKWDIYNMYASGTEPRRMTFDSSAYVGNETAQISPDGSLIAYSVSNARTSGCEIRCVSALGGASKVIARIGVVARWRPDGKRIGFIRARHVPPVPSPSGWKEFWSVEPNGNDERLEFADSVSSRDGNFCFSWSPDGKSIAWLRTFRAAYQEIVVRELATGKEQQLTHEARNIDELIWTSNGHIIYSSNRAGSTTLWMIPEGGGESVQVTKEGPDMGMTISSDCQRMVFLRRQSQGFLWRMGSDGSNPKQLTSEGKVVQSPRMSPDRKWIAYWGGTDEFGAKTAIYVVDRDGNGRREVAPSDEQAFNPRWSPDGRWLAYSAQGENSPIDSSHVVLLDAASLSSPRRIGVGIVLTWTDPNTILVHRNARSWQLDIRTRSERLVYQKDSVYAIPTVGGKFIWLSDYRSGRLGRFIVPVEHTSEGEAEPQLLHRYDELVGCTLASDQTRAYVWDDRGSFWKMLLPSGVRVLLARRLPGLTRASSLGDSYDGKEIVYVEQRRSTKLMLVENLFE
jgi:serine/threonine protein kinase